MQRCILDRFVIATRYSSGEIPDLNAAEDIGDLFWHSDIVAAMALAAKFAGYPPKNLLIGT